MSLTLLQRFYEIAKQEAEAPALGVEIQGAYLSLPWWFVKSRVKHFGLGLVEAGAQAGDYFYLFPSRHPTWIYSELGALSMGLQTVPLPAGLEASRLQELFHQYPPAFVYWGEGPAVELNWSSHKTLKALITKADDTLHPEPAKRPCFTFREIFNSGIRNESKHHAAYRKIRDSLEDSQVMSPITVDYFGKVTATPLRYEDVNNQTARLSQAFRLTKCRRIFSDVDLSWTLGRVAALYWPLFLAMQALFAGDEKVLFSQLRSIQPDILFLSEPKLQRCSEEIIQKFSVPPAEDPSRSKASPWVSWLRRRRISHWLRRQWGKKLRVLLSPRPIPSELKGLLASAKIRALSLEELE